MKIKYLFFDFDGTVSDAKRLTEDCLISVLDDYGFDFRRRTIKKVIGSKMPEIFKQLGVGLLLLKKVRRKFWGKMVSGAKSGKIKLCVSVKPLKELKKKGHKLVVITNAHSRFTKTSLKVLGIKNLFSKIYGAEKFSTKDELLEKLFEKFHISPHEAVYIGDRFSDIKYAREAGCYAVAIHNKCSWSSKEDIMKEKPDFIVKDFHGLKGVLRKLE